MLSIIKLYTVIFLHSGQINTAQDRFLLFLPNLLYLAIFLFFIQLMAFSLSHTLKQNIKGYAIIQ